MQYVVSLLLPGFKYQSANAATKLGYQCWYKSRDTDYTDIPIAFLSKVKPSDIGIDNIGLCLAIVRITLISFKHSTKLAHICLLLFRYMYCE